MCKAPSATTIEVAGSRKVSPCQRALGEGGHAAITAGSSVKGYTLEVERVAPKGASIVFEALKSILLSSTHSFILR